MKKRHLALIFASLLLVGGCGTNSSSSDNSNNDSKEQADPIVESNGSENTVEEDNKENQTDGAEETLETTLTYESNDEEKVGTSTLVNSENQEFSIELLPEFELIAEEPRKDLLILKDNQAISMRIELLPEDLDWTVYEDNISIELSNVSDTIYELTDKALLIDNSNAYEAKNAEECVTIYLVKDSKMPLKLTMFTTEEQDYRSALVEMAKTISKLQ